MKTYDLQHPPLRVELHDIDCVCPSCRPYAPCDDQRLDATALGKLTTFGFLVATAIAAIIDPTGMAGLLRDMVGL